MPSRPTRSASTPRRHAPRGLLVALFAAAWLLMAAASPTRGVDAASPHEPRTGEVVCEYRFIPARDSADGAIAPNPVPPGIVPPLRGPGPCAQPDGRCQAFDAAIVGGERFGSESDLDSRSADSFVAGSASATSLCWWGAHRVAGAPGSPPAGETFTIRYYASVNGLPGAPVGAPMVVTPTASATGVIQNDYTIIEYTATHPAVALTPGSCYWVEIRQNQYAGNDAFIWWASDIGNGYALHDLDDTTPYANFDELDTLDLAFCCNAAAEGSGGAPLTPCGSPAPTDPVCGLTPLVQCQDVLDPSQVQAYLCNPGTQVIADDIRVASTMTLEQICWKGAYAVEPPATSDDDQFTIRVYADDQGKPGDLLRDWFDGFLTVTRGYDGHNFDYTAEVSFDPLTLNAGECYWVEITNNLANTDGEAQWAWLTAGGGNSRSMIDGGVAALNGYNLSDTLSADMALCVSGTLSLMPPCPPPEGIPANSACDQAAAIALGQTLTSQTNINAPTLGGVTAPPCGYTLDNRSAVWYRYKHMGAAQSVVASTCFPNTDFDTVIDVYCAPASSGCGSLSCQATNDINAGCGDTTHAAVSWWAEPTKNYWLRVHGKGGNVGVFDLSLMPGGSATPTACTPCDVVQRPGDVVESEACGDSTNASCAAAGVQTLAPGQVFFGASEVDGGMRSGDVIRFGPFPNTPALFSFAFEAEHPTLVQVLAAESQQDCLNDLFDNGYQVPYQPCSKVNFTPASQYMLDPKIGYVFVRILPATSLPGYVEDFYGMPCGSGINDYRVSLSTSGTGACCTGSACSVGTAAACALAGGAYHGDGSTCAAGPCCAADFNGVNGVTVQDIFDFLTAWLAGNTTADFNDVNGVTVQDIFDFLTAWLAGC